jgi:hypothetical protein
MAALRYSYLAFELMAMPNGSLELDMGNTIPRYLCIININTDYTSIIVMITVANKGLWEVLMLGLYSTILQS